MYRDKFNQYLRFEKRYSFLTVQAYERDLDQFFIFLSDVYSLDGRQLSAIERLHIRSWIVDLMEKGLVPKTIQRKLSTLRSFFRFLMKTSVIERDPTAMVKAPKVPSRLPVYVDEEKMNDLLKYAVPQHDEEDKELYFNEIRDQLIINLLYNTGIRRAELINIRPSDVDVSRRVLLVTGKGNKQRQIPLSNNMLEMVDHYLIIRNDHFSSCSGTKLLVTNKGSDIYPQFVYRTVKKFINLVSTTEKKSPHVLRHSFATHLANKGADLNAIKELLGHASLASTQVYTHNSIDRLKEVYLQAHPKSK